MRMRLSSCVLSRGTRLAALGFAWAACASGAPVGASAPRAAKAPVPLADYLDVRRTRDASFSHDERLVAYRSDAGGRFDAWVQPVGGGPARQVTHVNGVIHSFAFSPTRDVLLYEVDEGGNDATRIYATDSEGRDPRELRVKAPPERRGVDDRLHRQRSADWPTRHADLSCRGAGDDSPHDDGGRPR